MACITFWNGAFLLAFFCERESEWAKPYPAIPCLSSPFYSSWWLLYFLSRFYFHFISHNHTSIYSTNTKHIYTIFYYNIQPAAGEHGNENYENICIHHQTIKYILCSFIPTYIPSSSFSKNFQLVSQPITIQQCHCYPKPLLELILGKQLLFYYCLYTFLLGAYILFLLVSAILFQSYSILLRRFPLLLSAFTSSNERVLPYCIDLSE